MITEIFTVCDFAQDSNGKLTLVGTFDNIQAGTYPCVHRQCAVAARLRFSENELGRHKITITLKNEKGDDVLPAINLDADFPNVVPDGYVALNLVFNIEKLIIKEPGKIAIQLFVDEEWQTALTLTARHVNRAA